MNELERFEKLKKLGWKYDLETGHIFNRYGTLIKQKNSAGYVLCCFYEDRKKRYNVKAHRFAWWLIHNEIPNVIDHINQIKDDNRLVNLRNITKQQNSFNTLAKGYTFCKTRKKFQAKIVLNGKNYFLGRFNTEQEARQAYLEAKKIHHII